MCETGNWDVQTTHAQKWAMNGGGSVWTGTHSVQPKKQTEGGEEERETRNGHWKEEDGKQREGAREGMGDWEGAGTAKEKNTPSPSHLGSGYRVCVC